MNDKYTTFKAQVGIDEIASYLGYKLDRRAGVGRYIEMCLRDGAGRKTDSINNVIIFLITSEIFLWCSYLHPSYFAKKPVIL